MEHGRRRERRNSAVVTAGGRGTHLAPIHAMHTDARIEIDLGLADAEETSHVRLRPVAEIDPQSALDTAIAMVEMERHERALAILEPVARSDDDARLDALWLMARCYVATDRPGHAERCLEWALLDATTELRRVALLYELGATHEISGARAAALECYRRVAEHMPTFRGVHDRIRALSA